MQRNSGTVFLFALSLIGMAVGQTQPVSPDKSDNFVPQVVGGRIGLGLAGEWIGTLEAGGRKLQLALRIRTANHKYSATLDRPDQKAVDMPADSAEMDSGTLTLGFGDLDAEFTGKLSNGESELQGKWEQKGKSFPLTFRRAQPGEIAKEPVGLPASLSGFQDDATFNLVVGQERIRTMKSVWKTDGSVETRVVPAREGQTGDSTRITPGSDGRWTRIVMGLYGSTITIVRQGTSVTRTSLGRSQTWDTREGVLLFDSDTPILISQVLRAYDRAKAGVQRFPVLLLPGTPFDLNVQAGGKVRRSAGGREISLTKFTLQLPTADMQVFADDANRVYLVEIPSQKSVYVREGYEALRSAAMDH